MTSDFKFLRGDTRPMGEISLPMISRAVPRLTDVQPIDGPNPERPSYYDVEPGFMCVGVTPRRYNPHTYVPYRHLVYENLDTGRMIEANMIDILHPMFNFWRQIEPEFYNSHYVDRI
jgi:hypothetical protein